MILDFEGSSIPEIAFFFKGFDTKVEEYFGLKYKCLACCFTLDKKVNGRCQATAIALHPPANGQW